MFSKIVSQFFFTCSTFLLLSASLFSMERGEGPGEKKKGPALSTEQKKEMSRRAEESSEDEEADPSNALARSMGGCQLGDPTISHIFQEKGQEPSSLQPSDSSGMDDGMSAIIPFMGSPARRAGASASVTPGEEEQMKQAKMGEFGTHTIQAISNSGSGKASIITPSPTKRYLQLGPTNLNDPQNLFASPSKIVKVDPDTLAARMAERAEQMAGMHQAVLHGNQIAAYAEATKKAILPVYRVFNPKDAKKTNLLTEACRDRAIAQRALTTVIKDLKDVLSQGGEHADMPVSDADLLLKLSLATDAVQEATENVKTVAGDLMTDSQYRDGVNAALADLRAVHARGVDLFKGAGSITQPLPVEEGSMVSLAEKKVVLEKKIKTAEATLQYVTELRSSVIDPMHDVFHASNDDEEAYQHEEELFETHQQLEAEIALMKVAMSHAKKDHAELQSFPEESARFFDELDVTTRDVNKATGKIGDIVQYFENYEGLYTDEAEEILKNFEAIHSRYEASLSALEDR